MRWNQDRRFPIGGKWACAVKRRESCRRWREVNIEWDQERKRRWRKENPEKCALGNDTRIMMGGVYLGKCRFTETEIEAMVNGASE